MASGTKSGSGVLPLLLIGGLVAVAVFGGSKVVNGIESLFGGGTSLNSDYAVATAAKGLVQSCSTDQVLDQRKCGNTKIVVMDAAKMPYITRNIQLAWGEGKSYVLTRNSALQNTNRSKACGSFVYKYASSGGSCDEYPFATTSEGGEGARTEEVYIGEQRCQGGTVSRGYQIASIANGDTFLVVISHPANIASQAWQGQAETVGSC